jgi:hypothetical protein
MAVDYRDYAEKLKIKPVWAKVPENDTGYLTPPSLYQNYRPFLEQVELIHATVGSNTLPYFADKVDAQWNVTQEAGSIRDKRFVCAHQLIPADSYTIYDMVPAGYGCGHCNPGSWRGVSALNFHARGYELENLQNGTFGQRFTESQYIKLAFSIAYNTAIAKVRNIYHTSHFGASMEGILSGALDPRNAHTDPERGPFDWTVFHGHLWEIRKPESGVFDLWQLPVWDGRI